MSITSTDQEVLVDIGHDFVVKVARVAFGALFYGIYLILMYCLITLFIRRGRKLKSSTYLVVVTILMFLGSTTFLAFDISDLITRMELILINRPGEALQDKLDEADDRLKRLVWTGNILFIFMLPLGDSVVFWRTWALYPDNKKIMLIPLGTLVGSITAALYELGCDLKTHWAITDLTPSAGSVGAEKCAHADLSSFTLSFATNVICTVLIVYKAWEHRKLMDEYLDKSRQRTQAERVLTLLIESGAAYLVLYTLQSIPIYDQNLSMPADVAMNVINAIIQQGMGIYPTAIVVIVQMQRTFWAESEEYDSKQTANSRPGMLFAPPPNSSLGTATTGTNFDPGATPMTGTTELSGASRSLGSRHCQLEKEVSFTDRSLNEDDK